LDSLAEEMHMPSLPEMLFGDNVLRIQHSDSFGIQFNAIDALKCVNNLQDSVKVACAQEWQETRADSEHSKEVVKRYDWTYTTDYKGTLLGDNLKFKVTATDDRIDMEKLKAREQIMFFEDVLLFEDELHDHGVSMVSVKIVSNTALLQQTNYIMYTLESWSYWLLMFCEMIRGVLLFPKTRSMSVQQGFLKSA
ncbi:TIPRL protein, partial [Polyodon spathula]|nr:TIPRL protein [Polyodon spathula]